MTAVGTTMAGALADAAARLREASDVVVLGHVDPDGDALGSIFALTAALRHLGVPAVASWGSREAGQPPALLPPGYDFLPCLDAAAAPDELPAAPDVLVCCDTAAPGRLGTLAGLLDTAGTTIVVDHHATATPYGTIRVVDPAAAATTVLVAQLIAELAVPLDEGIANALYLGLVTDTGRFSFSSTSPSDLRLAAELMEAGAEASRIARHVYDTATLGWLRLMGAALARVQVDPDADLIWGAVHQADFTSADADADDAEGLLDLLRRVADIDVACLMRETPGGQWRVSLRSRGGTDVAAIAAAFGGGGHRLAAGFTAPGPPEAIAAAVTDLLTAAGGRP